MSSRLLSLAVAICALVALTPAGFAQNTNGAFPMVFQNIAPQAGVNVPCFGRGGATVDLDGDGLLDLIATSASIQTYYFRQTPTGFQEMTQAWSIPQDTKQTWGVVAADFDSDGDPDLYFPCGGFHLAEPNRFLRNDLNTLGRFTLLTAAVAGDAVAVADSNFGCTAADFDRDGDLDLFTSATITYGSVTPQPLRLFRNDGNLHFTDVTQQSGMTHRGNFKHVGAGDFDNDGWMDFGVGDYDGPSRLYRNNHDGTFVELAAAVGVDHPGKNFGFVFTDFDNDGWQDVMLPKYLHGGTSHTDTTKLFLNNGDGTFRDVSAASMIGGQEDMGHNVGDINADGFPDIYIGAGHPSTVSLDVMYLVRPDGVGGLRALDVSVQSGIRSAGPGRNHGTPFADLNRDGYLDIWAVNGGPSVQAATIQEAYLWRAQGNPNEWFSAELRGLVSNRDAVGARMTALTQDGREIRRTVTAGKGFANTDEHRTHFGLGETQGVQYLQILWPSGIEQHVLAPALRSRLDVVESGIWTTDTARIGDLLDVDFCGPQGQEFDLFIGAAPSLTLRPDLGGFLRIAPPLVYLPPVAIGPTGQGVISLSIPNQSVLVGQMLYVQAGMHHPLQPAATRMLTNRLDLRIQ